MKRCLFAFSIASLVCLTLLSFRPSEKTPSSQIEWVSIEEAYKLTQKAPRKLLVDVYTDWCGWCKVMDKETYTDPKVADYINKTYYAVRFNAEQREAVTLGDQTFTFVAQGNRGVHQLALSLTNNRPSYPTTVFLQANMNVIQPLPGYLRAREFHEIITFFGDDYYQKIPFENYKATTYPAVFGK